MIDHVSAEFGGRAVLFQLPPGPKWAAAIALQLGPPLAALQRFATGEWSIDDVRRVLALAYQGAPNRRVGLVEEVDAVLGEGAPGRFAPLAVTILRAYLFGLTPEEAAALNAAPGAEA